MLRAKCKAAPQNKKADIIQAIIDFDTCGHVQFDGTTRVATAKVAPMLNISRSSADEQQLVSLDAAESQGRARLKLGGNFIEN